MVDLEAVLKKEGSTTAKRLLEQYWSNFVEPHELKDVVQKADETRKRLAKDGLGMLIPLLNDTLSTEFYDDDFKGASIVETPELIKLFEKRYGVICPTVSIRFPKERWGNGFKNRVKAFFKGYRTIIQKLKYPQDLLGVVKYYGFYVHDYKFKPNPKLFLDFTGISLLEDGTDISMKWAHEALHAAYQKHSRVNFSNLGKHADPYLGKLEKMNIAETIMDVSLLDEISARRGSQDIALLYDDLQTRYANETPQFYLSFAAAKYDKYAEENGIDKISKEYLTDLLVKKALQLNVAVYDVYGLAGKILQSQLTRILFTSAPTKKELSMKNCHSPFLDLAYWKDIIDKHG
ncbi:MAG: hypothetical protein Q8O03_08680 [Nanoarchaeota archaeon]|nr:hypothetical protein [Nanoarchaeota archaeon]